MNFNELAIATIAWARNKDEEALLRDSLTKLSQLNIQVFITDGGSEKSFIEFLTGLPNFTLLKPMKGLWMQTSSSLNGAMHNGFPYIFYTEPDKSVFFTDALPTLIKKAETKSNTGVILASRSAKGFNTFPVFQQMTETTINNCCTEVMDKKLDYVYGPFLMNSKIISYLKYLPVDIGWGWRPFAFNIAQRLGFEVAGIDGDFECPVDQKMDSSSERIYRMRQMNQNIEGLILSTKVDLERDLLI